ncbi:hypothetical protein BED30_18160 [Citrobacter portucalensis]|nr:hypothetical protein BED30_18160 [Citrobacter portucalensis]
MKYGVLIGVSNIINTKIKISTQPLIFPKEKNNEEQQNKIIRIKNTLKKLISRKLATSNFLSNLYKRYANKKND